MARQAPLSMGFPRQEYWSGLPFSSQGIFPTQRLKPESPALAGGFFTTEPPGKTSLSLYPSLNQWEPWNLTQGFAAHEGLSWIGCPGPDPKLCLGCHVAVLNCESRPGGSQGVGMVPGGHIRNTDPLAPDPLTQQL